MSGRDEGPEETWNEFFSLLRRLVEEEFIRRGYRVIKSDYMGRPTDRQMESGPSARTEGQVLKGMHM